MIPSYLRGLLLLLPLIVLMDVSVAHESRPAYLELKEQSAGQFDAFWRKPARGNKVLRLNPVFPEHCEERSRTAYVVSATSVEKWLLDCGSVGLVGQVVHIEGLEETLTDALVRVSYRDGVVFSEIVRGNDPQVVIKGAASRWQVIRDYLQLGIEHILGGIDHLLFVLCLLMLVSGFAMLVKTITAFTVAHSITLAMAALGFVSVPQAPVEAVIALSIVFLASELARQGKESHTPNLALRAPWLVAFSFGLLHGFGFAGALAEIGLPQNEIPVALLMFNVGVEVGQLLFVAVVTLLLALARRLVTDFPGWMRQATVYGIGTIASFWTIDRISGFWV